MTEPPSRRPGARPARGAPAPAQHGSSARRAAPKLRRARRRGRSKGCGAPVLLFCVVLAALVVGGGLWLSSLGGENNAYPAEAQQHQSGEELDFTIPADQLPYQLQTAPPYTVVLDPGHGGSDVGARGIIDEILLTETTVTDLYALLQADENYTPVRTRADGEGLSIADRAGVATQNEASLLLSIHGNYDESSQSNGFECFPTTPGRTYHAQAMQFADALAAAMEQAGNRVRGETGVRYVYYTGGEGSDEKRIVEASDTTVRAYPSFGVLEKSFCPAVLAEQCFLSNENDVATWGTPEGCARAAQVYYTAICAYFATTPVA